MTNAKFTLVNWVQGNRTHVSFSVYLLQIKDRHPFKVPAVMSPK